GGSLTALLSDATLAHLEWSRGREHDAIARLTGTSAPDPTRNRLAAGVTFTTAGKLSLTAEYEYNGFALSRSKATDLSTASPALFGAYVLDALRRQDLASREAFLVYATQKGVFVRSVDVTALMRVNADDHSRLGWLEIRNHWARLDVAVRLQQQGGRAASEYGLLPDRRSVQVVGSYYF
ncbi:MAG: hypothetical protein ABIV63_12605, partial [Caldimonas sp.]